MTIFFKPDGAYFLSRLIKFSFFIPLLLICFSACKSIKPGSYFKEIKRDTTIGVVEHELPELKIKKRDLLSISISSLSKEEDKLFSTESNTINSKDAGIGVSSGFLVDRDGNIYMHKLGKIKAEGLTRRELKLLLEKELLPYLRDPIVIVNFGNHHITVIGEIGKPQILPIAEDQISIVDVLAQSGAISQVTELRNVMVIREKDNAKEFRHLNLEDHSVFTSPYYYLQPNDVVVISQDEKIVKQQARREGWQQVSWIVLQTLSIIVIINQVFLNK